MPSNLTSLDAIETDAFLDMMRGVPAAVTVIATQHEGQRRGLTATAVCSLSADPPQLLVCINRQSSARPVIAESGLFSVNFLACHQEEIARCFAQASLDHEARFSIGAWDAGPYGVPVLGDAVATAICTVVSESLHDTHAVYVGRVVDSTASDAEPLLYHDRGYCVIERPLSMPGP